MMRILFVLIGYIFGCFQTGYFYGKLTGTDLKKSGSGNTGATNALRVMGIKSGLIVFFFDALKAFIPVMAVRLVFKGQQLEYVYALYTALGTILGNDFPFFLKFKGGKGVAATFGWGMAFDWRITLICLAFFFSIAFTTRYVSLASCLNCLAIIIGCLVFILKGWLPTATCAVRIEMMILITILALLIVIRHRSNIERLIHGTENRFGSKKK